MASSAVRFEARTAIQSSVGEVFERLADLSNYPRWMHRTGLFRRCGLTSEGPVRQGTTYFDATWMGTYQGAVTEFVRPSRIAFSETLHWLGSGTARAQAEFSLEGDDKETVVHHTAVGELFGWMRLMRPAAALMARVERTRTLKSLKRSLEPK